jgi:hypothetical protein
VAQRAGAQRHLGRRVQPHHGRDERVGGRGGELRLLPQRRQLRLRHGEQRPAALHQADRAPHAPDDAASPATPATRASRSPTGSGTTPTATSTCGTTSTARARASPRAPCSRRRSTGRASSRPSGRTRS